jgi:NADPH:quinone reductase-like Zn-dependent oxidoreductase
MRRYVLAPDGDRFRLDLQQVADPQPAPGEVLVRVKACSLNFRDLVMLRNERKLPTGGRVPLSDGAGEIVALGAGVRERQVGERVVADFFLRWPQGPFTKAAMDSAQGGAVDGMLAELVALPADAVLPIPEHLSFTEAATLPCAALTAWNALVTRGGLVAGQSVLVLGSGGVSVFALQIAHALKATVIATTSTPAKVPKLTALGASYVIDTRARADWEVAAFELTGKRGVDHVVEVGGVGSLERSIKAVAHNGHIALIGVLAGAQPPGNLFSLAHKNVTVSGIYVGAVTHFQAMNRFLAAHRIHPVIDRAFAFVDAAKAYDHLASGAHLGKVVITIP